MCGIAGVLTPDLRADELRGAAERMADALAHRGPDAGSTYVLAEHGLAFGHRRLRVLDLDERSDQPMHSPDQRWTLCFNGEIYNYRELRSELTGVWDFRTTGDSEVLLAAVATWGVEETVERCNGMFAFAAYDHHARELALARDRLGEKPLYYATLDGCFAFASQPRALRALWPGRLGLSPQALAAYFELSYIPHPLAVYEGVAKLPPATVLRVRDGRVHGPTSYWAYPEPRPAGDAGDDLEVLHDLLADAVARRMAADVPLGAFLSGGIDSSLVVALMQRAASRPVTTFTVAMPDSPFDEATAAGKVAAHLGTDHYEVRLRPEDVFDAVPRLPRAYDEPFADPAMLPTMLMSEFARRHVTVALSGDGGDEVFVGYNRYVAGAAALRRLRRIPRPARSLAARGLLSVRPARWDRMAALAPAPLRHVPHVGDKAHKLARMLRADDVDAAYRALDAVWSEPPVGARWRQEFPASRTPLDPALRMAFLDGLQTLPEQMLTKVDRASMSVGLEVRPPLLDHRVVELAARLPLHAKVAGGKGKVALRQLLARHVPPALTDRPKMGFDPPMDQWLRGPLRSWTEDLLAPAALAGLGGLDVQAVRATWADHLAGRGNHGPRLWAVLMLQAWTAAE